MQENLTKKLFNKYPKIFSRKESPITESLMAFGFECGDGWYWLIDQLCESIQTYIDNNTHLNIPQVIASQVKEKYGCYDKETEVLTKNGWKFFKDLNYNDFIATLENNKLVYYKPLDIISYKYDGKMYKLVSRGVDLLTTPNHNLYVAKGNYYNGRTNTKRKYDLELATPDKFFKTKKRFLKSCEWDGKDITDINIKGYTYSANIGEIKRTYIKKDINFEIFSFLKFLGFYVAEGCCNLKRGDISIACNNTDGGKERKMCENLITDLGYKIKVSMENNSAVVYKIYDKRLAIWLNKEIGHLAHNKKVPEFIKELKSCYILEFLKYLYIGDGHTAKTSKILYTVSKKLSEDVEELILKCGFSFRTSKYPPKSPSINGKTINGKHYVYCTNWLKKTNDFNIETKTIKNTKSSYMEDWVDYNDFVYCVTVPNNIIFVKRNGKGVWCGNSLRFYVEGGDELTHGMIWLAEHMSDHICEECGSKEDVNQTKGWIKTLCKICESKQ